jgi:inhibitor of cysteine peptidase
MKKTFLLLASLAVISLVLAGCSSGGNGENDGVIPQDYTDPSTTINVNVGENFAISMDSNATTGYEWQLAAELDESVVEQVGDPQYIMEEGAEERVGAGGTEVWTFKGVGAGDTTISFEYVRPWEEEEEPAETKDFKVEVS